MKTGTLGLLLMGISFSCCDSNDRSSIRKDDFILEGKIIVDKKDTFLQGQIKFRDPKNNIVVSMSNYENNKRNGPSEEYYGNGTIYSRSNYENNLLNGKAIIYDTSGKKVYEKYYYHGLGVGSVSKYQIDKIKEYLFVTFEGAYLYKCEYNSSEEILEQGNLLNYVTKYEMDGDDLKLSVFLYLVSPPHKRVTYKLFDKDLSSGDSTLVFSWFADSIPFKDFAVDVLSEGHAYLWNVETFYFDRKITVSNVIDANKRALKLPPELPN